MTEHTTECKHCGAELTYGVESRIVPSYCGRSCRLRHEQSGGDANQRNRSPHANRSR